MNKSEIVGYFKSYFQGNENSFGQYLPKDGKMFSKKKDDGDILSDKEWNNHILGKVGLGRVPILDDGTCWFAAIDIDCHDGSVINKEAIAKKIFNKSLPLIPCVSKSGGVHCYLFGSEPLPAELVRVILRQWAVLLGHGGSEIFPKQSKLLDNTLGNWINLPYFDVLKENKRVAIVWDGSAIAELPVEKFIESVETKRIGVNTLKELALLDHEQAPPCLQEILMNGVKRGQRNEALYNFAVYLKRAKSSTTYKEEIHNLNEVLFDPPLQKSEVNKLISSVNRGKYKYRCLEAPIRNLCDMDTCLKREFGVDRKESKEISMGGMPEFSKLRVYITEPPMWELVVDGIPIIIPTRVLRNFNDLAEIIMERLLKIIPLIPNKDWLVELSKLMEDVESIELPDDASVKGQMRYKLLSFISRANMNVNGTDVAERDMVLRGFPVVQRIHEGVRAVIFRGEDFISYLKRNKAEELKGVDLYMALKQMGLGNTRVKINGRNIRVWYVQLDGRNRTRLDPDFNPSIPFTPANKSVEDLVDDINF